MRLRVEGFRVLGWGLLRAGRAGLYARTEGRLLLGLALP